MPVVLGKKAETNSEKEKEVGSPYTLTPWHQTFQELCSLKLEAGAGVSAMSCRGRDLVTHL